MLGENPDEANEKDSFPSKPISVRAAVLMAGSTMNLVLALVVFFIISFFLIGVPGESSQIGYIVEDSPAQEAGLEPGDTITAIDGEQIDRWDQVLSLISVKAEQELLLEVERNGTIMEVNVEAEKEPETARGVIGIGPEVDKYSFIPSIQRSFEQFGMFFVSVYYAVSGEAPLDVAGPVGIVHTIGEVAQVGFVNLLLLTGLISINLGIINLLPIPALDGGRLLFLLIEAVRGRPVEPEREGLIHFIGFAVLITLILLVTYQDILRFIVPDNN